eukprot:10071-Chlamydomonas_euryale.AAC.2
MLGVGGGSGVCGGGELRGWAGGKGSATSMRHAQIAWQGCFLSMCSAEVGPGLQTGRTRGGKKPGTGPHYSHPEASRACWTTPKRRMHRHQAACSLRREGCAATAVLSWACCPSVELAAVAVAALRLSRTPHRTPRW